MEKNKKNISTLTEGDIAARVDEFLKNVYASSQRAAQTANILAMVLDPYAVIPVQQKASVMAIRRYLARRLETRKKVENGLRWRGMMRKMLHVRLRRRVGAILSEEHAKPSAKPKPRMLQRKPRTH